ncbi:MAG TPA: Xaa-Pro peptidase family protein, partial [Myxococcaceae bacterium]
MVGAILEPLTSQAFRIPMVVLALLGAVLLAWRRPRRLLAANCALLGGWLVVRGLDLAQGWVLLTSLVLFGLQERHRRRWQEPRRSLRPEGEVFRSGLVPGAIAAAAVLVLPAFVPELPPTPPVEGSHPLGALPFAERRARLHDAAPHGGLIWPLPSEAIFWGDVAGHDLYPRVETLDARFLGAEVRGLRKLPGTTLQGAFSLHSAISRFRRVPDPPALERLRAAARATALALAEVAPRARDGLPEAELARQLEEAMARRGCERGSFPPIVASGGSVGTGHGSGNRGKLVNGSGVVIDIGCRVDGYVSDFTRTLPVGGTFSPTLRPVYEGVLEAQRAAEAACRAGVLLGRRPDGRRRDGGPRSLEEIAREVLRRELGRDSMGHALGHTVGLFVHDVRTGGPLQPGMVITLEPGDYGPTAGVRIEDTYLVTQTGCERLTEGFPADPERIEAAMQAAPTR